MEAKKGSNQAKNESMSDSEKKQDSEGDSEVRDCQVLVTLSNGELSVFEDDCTQGADGALCERPTLAQTPICPPMWYLFNGESDAFIQTSKCGIITVCFLRKYF